MEAVFRVGVFSLGRLLSSQPNLQLIPLQLTTISLGRKLCSGSSEAKLPANPKNESLLENLNLMGVDLKMVCQRQPGILRKPITNEKGLTQFLLEKGANQKIIASIVSRYPRAITRSVEHLEERWRLWRNVFKTDSEIVSVLHRSPESFFRTSDNKNMEENLEFLNSLRMNTKDLHRLLTTAPRTISNSVALNKQMLDFLEDTCAELGGKNPEQFARNIISKNLYILITSTKRVKTNIDNLKSFLKLSNSELLTLIEGNGAEILDLSNEYLKNNFSNLQQKMTSLRCKRADLKKLVIRYPMVLYIGSKTLNCKLDCLLMGGITMKQIVEKPRVLDYSTQNITLRLKELQKVGYDFETNGISILDSSRKRFDAKMEKLSFSPEE